MIKVIVIGGGWAGCSAAITAKNQGSEVLLLERTDQLLGLGNAGGIMRNNGRYTAAEENILMGGGSLFDVTDRLATHRDVDFPGHRHASFYNVIKIEPAVERLMASKGISVEMPVRIVDVIKDVSAKEGTFLKGVVSEEGTVYEGDVFIDCTGTTGPMGNCTRYGNGCAMCALRCPSFGPRVSISALSGGEDYFGLRADGTPGAFSGSCKLEKESLSKGLQRQLEKKGVAVVPLPDKLRNPEKLDVKVCRQYALPQYSNNLILIDTGHVKIMTPYIPISKLRQVEGLENARVSDPCAGGVSNSIRFLAVTKRGKTMKVKNSLNLYCAGEKAGPYIGHTEAISSGNLAGYNAAHHGEDNGELALPDSIAIGSFFNYENKDGRMITFAGGEFFAHMKERELYTLDREVIKDRIKDAGLLGIYGE